MGAKYTQAQNKATQKYIKNAYDSIVIRVPKGQREELKALVKDTYNMSLQAFILQAINEKIENRRGNGGGSAAECGGYNIGMDRDG